jgi:hypothetical protein
VNQPNQAGKPDANRYAPQNQGWGHESR